jgi:hypothetical protein
MLLESVFVIQFVLLNEILMTQILPHAFDGGILRVGFFWVKPKVL